MPAAYEYQVADFREFGFQFLDSYNNLMAAL